MKKLQLENRTFAAKRPPDYLAIRKEVEGKMKELFILFVKVVNLRQCFLIISFWVNALG
ncbi:hypothetical protein WMO40_16185 [Bacillaceae bacterium CLA-AA-H227]|uniref:Uncharacterized protein n=1 Tax=Robertmurraya yapensis (ex Hitch et al 2024) TaxID=3133160 RepID=A0ACC6SDQ3_9BACI